MKNNILKKISLLLTALLLLQFTAYNQEADDDRDGIANSEDLCPMVAGTKANKGCPEDSEESEDTFSFAESVLDKNWDNNDLFCNELDNAISKFEKQYQGTLKEETSPYLDGVFYTFNKPLFENLRQDNYIEPNGWMISASSQVYEDRQSAQKIFDVFVQKIKTCTATQPTTLNENDVEFRTSKTAVGKSGNQVNVVLLLTMINLDDNRYYIALFINPEK